MAATTAELLQVREISKDSYETIRNPESMGNTASIAYGGCAMGVAVNTAYQTVSKGYHCYSALGNFLGPTFFDRKILCSVRRIRDTRTFATRQVEVSQVLDDGSSRLCMIVLLDFQVQEPADFLTFSTPPSRNWPNAEDVPGLEVTRQSMLDKGLITKEMADWHAHFFALGHRFWDWRYCEDSPMAQNLFGIAKTLPAAQDHLSLTEKISADWTRSKHKLDTEAEHVSALAFLLDAALSFIPVTHNHQYLDDCGACSSLDFALRFFSNDVNFNEYHLRELKAIVGREGRSYTEAKLWDKDGRLVATMTQQSILRPKPETKPKM